MTWIDRTFSFLNTSGSLDAAGMKRIRSGILEYNGYEIFMDGMYCLVSADPEFRRTWDGVEFPPIRHHLEALEANP